MRRDCAPTWIDGPAVYRPLQRVRFGDRDFSEDFLQATLHACPDLLPVGEFERDFGPLVSVGREVDAIDNLYVAPSGKITIVETKLWRNPEATRNVVAQILDYATRLTAWSYETFEDQCRRALPPAPLAGTSLYSLVHGVFPSETPSESEFIDSVERSLRLGRFLLLVVGDGIREGLPELLGALHAHPRLQFTFGLVELQVFREPNSDSGRLIVPHVVANSTEVVRAVVRVETTGHADVSVEIEDLVGEEEVPRRRRTLSEEEFFDKLAAPEAATVRTLLERSRDLGALVQFGSGGVSVRLQDPGGTKQKLTLFVVRTVGDLYTGWLPGQLETVGIERRIGVEWVRTVASRFPGVEPSDSDPSALTRYVTLRELGPVLDDFVEQLGETIEAIRRAET